MSDAIFTLLTTLGRTTLWLAVAALAVESVLRLVRPASPAAHRAAWVLVLLVGWTFARWPVALPWYELASVGPVEQAELPSDVRSAAVDDGPAELVATDVIEAQEDHSPAMALAESKLLSSDSHSHEPSLDESTSREPATAELPPFAASRFDWPLALFAAWVLGMVTFLGVWIAGYVRFARSICPRTETAEEFLAPWRALLAEAGIAHEIPLCVTDEMGPALCRLPRGYVLVVPARLWRSLNAGEQRAILRHELAHYLRGDVWKSLVARALALPHWFNPGSWWAVRRFDEAAEWACDHAAAGDDEATDYARLLVRLGESGTQVPLYGSAARGRPLAARVRRILIGPTMKDSTVKRVLLVAALALVVAASAVRLRLVAREPDSKEELGVVGAQSPKTPASEAEQLTPGTSLTVSPYLEVLQKDSETEASVDEDAAENGSNAKASNRSPAQKMVDEARAAYEATQAAYFVEDTPIHSVYDWSRRWMEAAQRAAASEEERIAAARDHLKRMRDHQHRIALLAKHESKGGESKWLRSANYYVAEAERNLAEAEGVPSGSKVRPIESRNSVATEVQVIDLQIKISELKGQREQTKLDMAAAREAHQVAAQVVRKNPEAMSRVELTRLSVAPQKLEQQLASLDEQLALHQLKLKLLTSQSNPSPQAGEGELSSKAKRREGPPLGVENSSPDQRTVRFEGKPFQSWAGQLRDELAPQARVEAIQALSEFGANGFGPEVAKLILSALGEQALNFEYHPDKKRRSERDPVSNARRYAATPFVMEGSIAAEAFGAFLRIPKKDSVPILIEALKSDSAGQRIFAMRVLTCIVPDPADIPKLLAPLLKDPLPVVRYTAANTLVCYDATAPYLVETLRGWLYSKDSGEAFFAAQAVINSESLPVPPGREARPLVRLMPFILHLLDREEPLKTQVRQALWDGLNANGTAALAEAAKSNDEATRKRAEAVLKEYEAAQPAALGPSEKPAEK